MTTQNTETTGKTPRLLKVYTDGACEGRKDCVGGWAALLTLTPTPYILSGIKHHTDSLSMEVRGAIEALNFLSQDTPEALDNYSGVRIVTDCKEFDDMFKRYSQDPGSVRSRNLAFKTFCELAKAFPLSVTTRWERRATSPQNALVDGIAKAQKSIGVSLNHFVDSPANKAQENSETPLAIFLAALYNYIR